MIYNNHHLILVPVPNMPVFAAVAVASLSVHPLTDYLSPSVLHHDAISHLSAHPATPEQSVQ